MPPRFHSLRFSPSKGEVWGNCALSTLLNQSDGVENEFMRRGTQAHAIGEALIREKLKLTDFDGEAKSVEQVKKECDLLDAEMEEIAEGYSEAFISKFDYEKSRSFNTPLVYLEQYVTTDFEKDGSSGGTLDGAIYSDADGGTLVIIDLKTGRTPVYAFDKAANHMSFQLAIYAAYFYENVLKGIYPVKNVELVIYQPLIKNTNSYTCTLEELLEFREKVILPAVAKANEEKLEAVVGSHCSKCNGRATCAALAKQAEAVQTDKEINQLSDEEIGDLLPRMFLLKKYVEDFIENATSRAKDGTKFPGYKLVISKVSRKIADEDKVAEILKAEGIDPYGPGKLITITEITKKLGKKRTKELISPYLTTQESGLVLVENQDPREEANISKGEENHED